MENGSVNPYKKKTTRRRLKLSDNYTFYKVWEFCVRLFLFLFVTSLLTDFQFDIHFIEMERNIIELQKINKICTTATSSLSINASHFSQEININCPLHSTSLNYSVFNC